MLKAVTAAGRASGSADVAQDGGKKKTLSPTVTGTSVLGIKFADGVAIASDTSCSYGKMTKLVGVSRMHKVNDRCVVAFTGEFSDFQYICRLLDNLVLTDYNMDDGASMEPSEVHEYLTRVLYNRRNKFNPLWMYIVVAGVQLDGSHFLGVADLLGSSYEGDCVATGFGNYLAIPLLRRRLEEADHSQITETQATTILEEGLRVLFYRDCLANANVQIAVIKNDGTVTIGEPHRIDSSWEVGLYKVPSTHSGAVGGSS